MSHSISHYKDRHRGVFNRAKGWLGTIPFRFVLIIPLCLAMIAYQLFITWKWEYSVMRVDAIVPVVYGWGYAPSILILYTQILYGYFSPNEDKELLRQRHERGDQLNRELGIVNKPAWWRRVRGDHLVTFRDKLLNNVNEVGKVQGVGRRDEDDFERHIREDARGAALNDDDIEMSSFRADDPNNPRVDRAGARSMASPISEEPGPPDINYDGTTLFSPFGPDGGERPRLALAGLHSRPPPPPYQDMERTRAPRGPTGRSNSTSTTNSLSSPPQQVKSMLDV